MADSGIINLFTNQTTIATSESVKSSGFATLRMSGTIVGGSLNIEGDFGDGEWQPFTANNLNQTLTVPGIVSLQPLKNGMLIRVRLVGVGGGTDVTVDIWV